MPVQPPTTVQTSSQTNNDTRNAHNLLCTPFGACEPCGPEDMNEPFCQPFGNRRLMHCVNSTTPDAAVPPETKTGNHSNTIPELIAWESCGRIPAKERADFYEFIACNVVFAIVALTVLFFRERRLRLGRARQLAARIGIGTGTGFARR
ncbi:hypothetical protein CPC08DRAFT_666468 [Agrocybe pediades]|nr:hypothetical protein CPC08DRAFT_666468 [Agrocybe pediades]